MFIVVSFCHIYALFPFIKYTTNNRGAKLLLLFLFVKALLDNYVLDETKPDPTDTQKSQEEDNFINTIAVAGGPMDIAYKYLSANHKTTAAVSSSNENKYFG